MSRLAFTLAVVLAACAPAVVRSTLPPTPVEVEPPAKPSPPAPELPDPPPSGGESELAPANGRTVVTETSIEILPAVAFVGNTAELTDGARRTLAAIALSLNANPDITLLEVRGHSDSREDPVTRAELSVQRADVVVAFLVAHEVAPARLVAYGASDTEPVSLTDDAANRRIELVILDRVIRE